MSDKLTCIDTIEVYPGVFMKAKAVYRQGNSIVAVFTDFAMDEALDKANIPYPEPIGHASPRYSRGIEACRFIQENDPQVTFYSAESHEFDIRDAVNQAIRLGCCKVLTENLS